MIRFTAFGIEFRMHVLTFIAAIMAVFFGLGREVPYIALAVGIHELMHIFAASVCGIDIEYVEIMWFGGAAHVRDIYSAKRSGVIVTALAGPAANLLVVLSVSALAWWEFLDFYTAARLIRINMMLMLFNLMPALPLDGGRVFFAAASMWLKPSTAMRISVAMAHLLAAALTLFALCGWYIIGKLNITLILMAVFLISASLSEMRAYDSGKPGRAIAALCETTDMPAYAALVAYPADIPVASAAGFMKAGRATIFAITEKGEIRSLVTGEEMARRILNGM